MGGRRRGCTYLMHSCSNVGPMTAESPTMSRQSTWKFHSSVGHRVDLRSSGRQVEGRGAVRCLASRVKGAPHATENH